VLATSFWYVGPPTRIGRPAIRQKRARKKS
jgi:hypothetical protein